MHSYYQQELDNEYKIYFSFILTRPIVEIREITKIGKI